MDLRVYLGFRVEVGRVSGQLELHSPGLHCDDTYRDTSQASPATHYCLGPGLHDLIPAALVEETGLPLLLVAWNLHMLQIIHTHFPVPVHFLSWHNNNFK